MNLSFTSEYYPDLAELTDEQLTTARAQVVAALQPEMPDIDLSPGTPTGDFVVTPLAAYRAVAEEANSRLMSDLDLSNVANGLIYSCAFVQAYLGNFAVYDVENLKAFGLVRLSYSSPDARTIPRTARFRFGTTDDWSIRVVDPTVTEITVLAPGSSHTGDSDTYILAQTSANTWAVDIPLQGVLSAPVVAGSVGTSTEVPAALVGVAAAIDFMSGLPSASLPELARMARKIAFSLTAGSRSSTRSLVYRHWPESNMVSPVIPGDQEMQRIPAGSAIALQAPAVDVYFRSSRDMQRETQQVRLNYVFPTGSTAGVFRGALPLLHRASRILGLEWSGTTTESYVASKTVYSQSTRADLYGSLHCGTRYEALYTEVIPVLDETGSPRIPLLDDADGQYAIFTVTYDADPLLETVSAMLESPDYRPAGVDVLAKSGPLLLFDSITVQYTKKTGVKTVLGAAKEKIVEYLRTTGFPDKFRLIAIHDIARYAGADLVISVTVEGVISVSAATRLFRDTLNDPGNADILANWVGESDLLATIPVSTVNAAANPFFIVDGEITLGSNVPDAWAATVRTIRYAVDAENIYFIEN
jgi:hypothetical protein